MSVNRLYSVLRDLIKSEVAIDYYGFYEAKVVAQKADGSVDVRVFDPRLPSSMTGLTLKFGIPGVTAKIPNGVTCFIGHVGGNPAYPYVASWQQGDLPTELLLQSTSKITLVTSNLYLAEDGATHPVPFGEKVKAQIKSLQDFFKTMVVIGNLGVPISSAAQITGITSYGAGTATTVMTAAQASSDHTGMNSNKTKTG